MKNPITILWRLGIYAIIQDDRDVGDTGPWARFVKFNDRYPRGYYCIDIGKPRSRRWQAEHKKDARYYTISEFYYFVNEGYVP